MYDVKEKSLRTLQHERRSNGGRQVGVAPMQDLQKDKTGLHNGAGRKMMHDGVRHAARNDEAFAFTDGDGGLPVEHHLVPAAHGRDHR